MYKENDLIRHGQEVSVLQMNSKEAARTAAAEDNIVFMTTNIRIDNNLPPVTVETLDIKRHERRRIQHRIPSPIQPGLACRHLYPLANNVRKHPLPAYPRREVRVVILPAIHLLDEADDMRGTVGGMQFQPFAEQLFKFVR